MIHKKIPVKLKYGSHDLKNHLTPIGADHMIRFEARGGDVLDAFRKKLTELCRSATCRTVPRTRDMPCRWFPDRVTDPETGSNFTATGAWDYVAEILENGHPFTILKMEKPEGSWAFVMKTFDRNGGSQIYIKLQLYPGIVVGRSFHYSESWERTVRENRSQ